MGTFYPLVSKAMTIPNAPGPYATAFFFAVGIALCALPVNYLLMSKPIDGGPSVTMKDYRTAPVGYHAAGVLGGVIWMFGGAFNFVASRVNFVGPAVSYSIGQGATMISAFWGVFVWREFASPSRRLRNLLIAMFVCFIAGLAAISLAPLHGK
jgi:glucose uptake protein